MRIDKNSTGAGVFIVVICLASCSSLIMSRQPASLRGPDNSGVISPSTASALRQDAEQHGGKINFVQQTSFRGVDDFWHLSEGSDFFPYHWLLTMQSQLSSEPGSKLIDDLDKKFGVVAETEKYAKASAYPLRWIGLSASWSESDPLRADLKKVPGLTEEELIASRLGTTHQVPMVGVNCAFCHSNEMQFDNRKIFLDGGPAMVNLRGFYTDLYGSTIITMLTPQLLSKFLKDNHYPATDAELDQKVNQFVGDFKRDLGVAGNEMTTLAFKLGNFVDQSYMNEKTSDLLRASLYQHRPVVELYMKSLLKMTTGMAFLSPELEARMKFLSDSIAGDPNLPTAAEPFSTIDAFGRMANVVTRIRHAGVLTANASFPALWGTQFRAQYHWNANTNSIMMRNIGQAFGLGAILTTPDASGLGAFNSTINLQNLARLESLVYTFSYPDWADTGEKLDLAKVERGCEIYEHTCVSCHDAQKERVGPEHALINALMPPRSQIGTDSTYLDNQVKPVDGVPFKQALFSRVGYVRDRYYQKFQIDPKTQAEWQGTALRGRDIFRDTSLGESGNTGASAYMNTPATSGYAARTLAGVWATAPYLHNGSVPNLYELLLPARLRSKTFFIGTRRYDPVHLGYRSDLEANIADLPTLEKEASALMTPRPGLLTKIFGKVASVPENFLEAKIQAACLNHPESCYSTSELGNGNGGHEGAQFGTELSDDSRYDLLEFLKVLRPPVEYSQNKEPLYTWDGVKCQVQPLESEKN